ncbi:hypothetical protein TUM19329_12200 [Legionella antarctica]|uniref:Uncharacterized protein n=2 Tax=Legionella antarctica TaxID=2708020 RepID=A0A6F8T344_9GAMM|nr:hypothetical protein TUM19329_12200 [Legionella antarctica]
MKYLVSCLLVLPLITSCVEQDQYYERNYYNPAPRVEVQRNSPNHYHHNEYFRSVPQSSVYHGRADLNQNRIIVNPRISQGDVVVQQNGPRQSRAKQNNAVRYPSTNRGSGVVQGKIHGHDNNVHSKPQQPVHAHEDTQETIHGHN